jgi:hypothetical protein
MRAWEGARGPTRTGGEALGGREREPAMTGKPTQSTAHAADPSSRPISGVHDQETGLDWDGLPLHLGRLELLKAGMMACLGVPRRLPSQQQQVRCMP